MSKQNFVKEYAEINKALTKINNDIALMSADISLLENLIPNEDIRWISSIVAIDNLIDDLYEQINNLKLTALDYEIKMQNLLK